MTGAKKLMETTYTHTNKLGLTEGNEIEKFKQKKQTTHSMSSVSHFSGSVITPSFAAILYKVKSQSHISS